MKGHDQRIKLINMKSKKETRTINDLKTWCLKNNKTELLDEWDYEKNGDIKPANVSKGSDIKAWWICPEHHSYVARIANKTTKNYGCPYCSGHKTLDGYNDFKNWCITNERCELLQEWHDEKNTVKPNEISPKSAKKIWWKCSLGHEWEATMGSRASGSGCPYCSKPPKKILVGFNDLETWCKENKREYILSEWNYDRNEISPRDVTFGSGKFIWWKCNKNHEWKAQVHNRTNGSKTNCPICSRTQTSFPEQAIAYYLMKEYDVLQRYRVSGREVDVFIPTYGIAIEYDGLRWHSDKTSVVKDLEKTNKITSSGVRLIRIRESTEKNSVIDEKEQYVIEFVASGGKYITQDFEWAISETYKYVNSISKKKKTPTIDIVKDEYLIRAHYLNVLKENSVATVFPELIDEWDIEKNEGVTPDSFSARNNKRVWWKCKYGHSWLASINTRGEHKLGCPYCAGQRVIYGENDLETWCKDNKPELLIEWDYEKNPIKPSEITKTSNKKVSWKCKSGHEWDATIANRVHGTRCPYCFSGNETQRYKTSLAEWCKENNQTQLLKEWDYEKNCPATPENITKGSHRKVWWKCSEGHEWQAQIKSRTYNHGCPFCSGTYKRAIVGINDLKTWCEQNDKSYILEEWDYDNNDITPEMVTFGSHKRIKWKCMHGHSWEAVIKERTKINGNMCPICRTL